MSRAIQPWWSPTSSREPALMDGATPRLLPDTRRAIAAALIARTPGYTPEWTRRGPDDAGMALVQLQSEQMATVLQRLNRLPRKAFVEFLTIGGVAPLAARPARALLQFEVAAQAPGSVYVPEGFACSARSQGRLVIFETGRALYAAPASLTRLLAETPGSRRELPMQGFLPFGARGDAALLIGLEGRGDIGPRLSLSLELAVADGVPRPVSTGSADPAARAALPQLRWDVIDPSSAQPCAVVVDETLGLTQSGCVELDLPARWRPTVLGDATPRRWLRLSIAQGRYAESPRLSALRINCVPALAARTLFDEVLKPVPALRPEDEGRLWAVSQTPVLSGSLQLEVDEGVDATEPQRVPWREVPALATAGPEDRVFEFDAASGVVRFGDGRHGAAAPRGFRHLHAVRYQTGGGAAGAVAAGAISTMLNSVAFLTKVANPLPTSGGADEESQADAVTRGPQALRARGRAVTVADYALLAIEAPGAHVARAHAVAGLHPGLPGTPRPGVVGVFVVPADGPGHPLVPDAGTLAAVASHLGNTVGPAGVEVVAAAPRYHRVRVEAGIVAGTRASAGETISRVLEALDRYLDPRVGGEDGRGWPFGGRLVHTALVQRVAKVDNVLAVDHLNLVVDGARVLACQDRDLSPHGLLEPLTHEVVIVTRSEP